MPVSQHRNNNIEALHRKKSVQETDKHGRIGFAQSNVLFQQSQDFALGGGEEAIGKI